MTEQNTERLHRFVSISKATAAVSAVGALLSVAIAVWQIRTDLRNNQTREWQETVVFSIIRQAPPEGLRFEEIQNRYTRAATDYKDELPREDIQTPALTKTLLSLLSKRAIAIHSDGASYGLALEDSPDATRMSSMHMVTDFIVGKVHDSPGKFTEDDLSREVRLAYPRVSEQDFSVLIGQGISAHILVKAKGGKLWLSGTEPQK